MNSIQRRLWLSASLVLLVFLGAAGLALQRAFLDSARQAQQQRLEAQLYGLLAAVEVVPSPRGLVVRVPPALLPEALRLPASGLYARVTDENGVPLWESVGAPAGSVVYAQGAAPGQVVQAALPGAAVGTTRSGTPAIGQGTAWYGAALAVLWELPGGGARRLEFAISEKATRLAATVNAFRRALLVWLGVPALVLLLLQTGLVTWGLRPLRAVANDLRRVVAGQRRYLSGDYPREIAPLTDTINKLIKADARRLVRQRRALADLAHSLKTPLAVLANTAGVSGDPVARDAVKRMAEIIRHQLRPAASAGNSLLPTVTPVAAPVRRLTEAMQKLHAGRGLVIGGEVAEGCGFAGDSNDLMEILGNLLDNACKWCRREVRVRAWQSESKLHLLVSDDGPGIDPARWPALLRHGASEGPAAGQGIGLAVAAEIVASYRGRLKYGRGPLSGANIEVVLPAR